MSAAKSPWKMDSNRLAVKIPPQPPGTAARIPVITSPSRKVTDIPPSIIMGNSQKAMPLISYKTMVAGSRAADRVSPSDMFVSAGAGILPDAINASAHRPLQLTSSASDMIGEGGDLGAGDAEWVTVQKGDKRIGGAKGQSKLDKTDNRRKKYPPSQLSTLSALLLPHLPDAVAESSSAARHHRGKGCKPGSHTAVAHHECGFTSGKTVHHSYEEGGNVHPLGYTLASSIKQLSSHSDFPSLPSRRADISDFTGSKPLTTTATATLRHTQPATASRHIDMGNVFPSALKLLKDTLRGNKGAIAEVLSVLSPADIALMRLLLLHVMPNTATKSRNKEVDPISLLVAELDASLRQAGSQTTSANLGRRQRLRLVRFWVMAAVKKALKLSKNGTIVVKVRAVGGPSDAGYGQRSKHKLSKLKKSILKDKVDRWLQEHPEAQTIYSATRSERLRTAAAVSEAEVAARKQLKERALNVLVGREQQRKQRLIEKGKLLPNGKVPDHIRSGKEKLADIKFKTAAQFSKRQVRKVMKQLITSGSMADPRQVSLAIAAELKTAHFTGSLSGQVVVLHTQHAVDALEEKELSEAAKEMVFATETTLIDTAKALASVDITGSTNPTSLKMMLSKSGSGGPAPVNAYVDQQLSADLDAIVSEMVSSAYFFQERQRQADARKAAGKKRILIGLREVLQACRQGKAKAVVIVPNIDHNKEEDGLYAIVNDIIAAARAASPEIPVIFALSRRKLGAALGKSIRASVVAFLSFENLRGLHTRALELTAELREKHHGTTAYGVTGEEIGGGGAPPPRWEEADVLAQADTSAIGLEPLRPFTFSADAPEWQPTHLG